MGSAKNGSLYSFTFRQFICKFLSVSCIESPHTTVLLGLSPSLKSDLECLCLAWRCSRSLIYLPSPSFYASVPTCGTTLSTAGQWSSCLACSKHYSRRRWFCGCWACATIKGRPLFCYSGSDIHIWDTGYSSILKLLSLLPPLITTKSIGNKVIADSALSWWIFYRNIKRFPHTKYSSIEIFWGRQWSRRASMRHNNCAKITMSGSTGPWLRQRAEFPFQFFCLVELMYAQTLRVARLFVPSYKI